MKNLRNKIRKLLWVIPIAVVLISLFAFRSVDFKTSKSLDIFFSFFRELSIFYVDKTDPENLINIGIEAILESLDPYNELITEDNLDALEFQTTGEYGGMGALIRHGVPFPIIAEIYEGSPAHKAGLMAGDIIKQVNEESVRNVPVSSVSKMLKGVPGSSLKVTVNRIGQEDLLTFEFSREKIHIPSVPYYGMADNGIGYIRLTNFTNNCNKEVEAALKDLRKLNAKGIILDLRGNPGGLLNEAVKIVNLFVDRNQLVVYTKGQIKEFDQQYKTQSRPVDTTIPLAVLVDRVSASASEIVAGALQDMDRAVIVGERTFGKGLVQATRPLPYNNQLKITTAKYYIPSGRCIQAVDYTQRNEDGSIGFIPDSLISEFTTRNGRKVYDGGGITPDIPLTPTMFSRIAVVLYSNNFFFDYATRFRIANSSIKPPGQFSLIEEQFNDFVEFVHSSDFQYQSQTEFLFNELLKASKEDKYYDLASGVLDSLGVFLKANRLKDLEFFKDELTHLLEDEIIGRYYLHRGKAKHSLNKDVVTRKSIDVLSNRNSYEKILSSGESIAKSKKEKEYRESFDVANQSSMQTTSKEQPQFFPS